MQFVDCFQVPHIEQNKTVQSYKKTPIYANCSYYAAGLALAPKSQEERKEVERSMALMRRHKAMTSAEIVRPMRSIANTLLPGPVERKPFMKERLGIKK